MRIKTSSWFTKLPSDHVRIGISRGTPRGTTGGYRRYMALAPGSWFNAVTPAEYLVRYGEILARLDPAKVAADLHELAGPNKVATLLCFESPAKIASGTVWCHRNIVAQWLHDRLGLQVEEVGYSGFDPWSWLRAKGVEPPSFR